MCALACHFYRSNVVQEGYAARSKGIYIISESKAIELFVNTLKQFVNAKISKRMQVVPNLEDLYNFVPKEHIPLEYGGTEESLIFLEKLWMDILNSEDHVKYLEMMQKAGTDESLRQMDKCNEVCMGMPGSFRSLTVD